MSNPDDHDEYVMEAFDYYYADYFADAEEKFRIAIAHNPSNALAFRGYHMSLAKQGKDTEARSAMQRSLELNPNDPESWFTLAAYLDDREVETSTAINAYLQGLKLDPAQGKMWRNLSILYKKSGDLDKSEEVIRHALGIWPDDRACLKVLEWNLRHQGRASEADAVNRQIKALEVESKRRQEELDREIAHQIKETLGVDIEDYDDEEDDGVSERDVTELDYITKIYEEGLPEEDTTSDDDPLVPNPPLKNDISGLFDEDDDVDDLTESLFGDDEDESDETSESEDEDDGMDALGALFYGD
ncbi:MAG: tetratricopeptide repeat protein [Candidatus Thorarchaeota archaeon]